MMPSEADVERGSPDHRYDEFDAPQSDKVSPALPKAESLHSKRSSRHERASQAAEYATSAAGSVRSRRSSRREGASQAAVSSISEVHLPPGIVQYNQTVNKMVNSITREYYRNPLRHLYHLNVGNARIELYREYLAYKQEYAESGEDGFLFGDDDRKNQLFQKKLDRYSRAVSQYDAFVASHARRPWKPKSDSRLIEVAARLTAIENLTKQTEPNETLIAHAKMMLTRYYHANILGREGPMDTVLGPEEARRQEEQDARAKEAEASRKALKKERKRYWLNLKMALFGGFALIIPMLIMTLHKTTLTTLLTTSIFVLVVAMILAAVMDTAEPKDVVGATAAYAAVLVVFVGTGGGSPTNNTNHNSAGGHHLSGGAIAGIVVGSVVVCLLSLAVFLLCCCTRGLVDTIFALVGAGRSRRTREQEELMEAFRRGRWGHRSVESLYYSTYYAPSYTESSDEDRDGDEHVSPPPPAGRFQPSESNRSARAQKVEAEIVDEKEGSRR